MAQERRKRSVLAELNPIQEGMTYAQVVEIIGWEGEMTSSSTEVSVRDEQSRGLGQLKGREGRVSDCRRAGDPNGPS